MGWCRGALPGRAAGRRLLALRVLVRVLLAAAGGGASACVGVGVVGAGGGGVGGASGGEAGWAGGRAGGRGRLVGARRGSAWAGRPVHSARSLVSAARAEGSPRVSVVIWLTARAARSQVSRARPAASAAAHTPVPSGAAAVWVTRSASARSRMWQLWLVTVLAWAIRRSDAAFRSTAQGSACADSQARCRTRSAVTITPSHKPVTASPPPRMRRVGSSLTGIAASSSRCLPVTGSCWQAARTEVSSTHSHWQAAFSLRRCGMLLGTPAGGDRARPAPWWAIRRAREATSPSSARVTGQDVTATAHSERCSQLPPAPGAKWVCSRSRPVVRETVTASSRRARGLAAGLGGHRRFGPPSARNQAALDRAGRACRQARAQG